MQKKPLPNQQRLKKTEISSPEGLIYEAQLQHPDSENAIQIKWVITDGMHYTLKSLVPKNQPEKAGFAQQVMQSFQPLLFTKKQSFFNSVKSIKRSGICENY